MRRHVVPQFVVPSGRIARHKDVAFAPPCDPAPRPRSLEESLRPSPAVIFADPLPSAASCPRVSAPHVLEECERHFAGRSFWFGARRNEPGSVFVQKSPFSGASSPEAARGIPPDGDRWMSCFPEADRGNRREREGLGAWWRRGLPKGAFLACAPESGAEGAKDRFQPSRKVYGASTKKIGRKEGRP